MAFISVPKSIFIFKVLISNLNCVFAITKFDPHKCILIQILSSGLFAGLMV